MKVLKNQVYKTAELTLTSAQILNLFSTPIDIIPAQGAGTQIIPSVGIIKYTHVGTPYATNVTLFALFNTVNHGGVLNNAVILTSTVSRIGYFTLFATGSSNPQYVENTSLKIWVSVGNPTAGNGTMKIVIPYTVQRMS
jgi:hypothetical protein